MGKQDWRVRLLKAVFKDDPHVEPHPEYVENAIELMDSESRQYLYDRYRDGMTLESMGKKYNRSPNTVNRWCRHAVFNLARNRDTRHMLLCGPNEVSRKETAEAEKDAALRLREEGIEERVQALEELEAEFDKRLLAFRSMFPALTKILPENPEWKETGVSALNLPFDIRTALKGQFKNIEELYHAAQNPKLRIRGLNKAEMKKVRRALRDYTGLPEKFGADPAVAHRFLDWNAIIPGNWSEMPIVLQFDPNRKPLEIGLYREPVTGEYSLQVFHGDNVIFRETVDVSLLMEDFDK